MEWKRVDEESLSVTLKSTGMYSVHTVLCISVRPRPKRVETRVIIKISTNPCYSRLFEKRGGWDFLEKTST